MCITYDGVPTRTVVLKSRMTCNCRCVFPVEVGTTVTPTLSNPACMPNAPVVSPYSKLIWATSCDRTPPATATRAHSSDQVLRSPRL